MELLFRCGHVREVNPDKEASPVCVCGETVIARALNPERPRITGHASGPLVNTQHLGAIAVSLQETP